jgi:hypothetical protein
MSTMMIAPVLGCRLTGSILMAKTQALSLARPTQANYSDRILPRRCLGWTIASSNFGNIFASVQVADIVTWQYAGRCMCAGRAI